MKAFIINYNRLTLMKNVADWCFNHGLEPIIIDNNSNYPPLISYYERTDYEVLFLNINCGHTVLWNNLKKYIPYEEYILTDPDLDLTGVPADFLNVMRKGLDLYPVDKCGLSLEINDLPDTEEGNLVRYKFESKYWKNSLPGGYFQADTDTTFALYRKGVKEYSHSAIRTDRPYTAKHLPWYYSDLSLLPEDEQNYYKTASESCSSKKRLW